VLDGQGNPVLQSGVLIAASIASGPAGGSLGGSVVASTGADGIATFGGLVLSGPAGSYVLGFASAGLPAISSAPITLSAGAGASLSLTTQPSTSVANATVFPQQPVIQLRDAANNPVAQAGPEAIEAAMSTPDWRTGLPWPSSTLTAGCRAMTTPLWAVCEGWVTRSSVAGEPAVSVMAPEVIGAMPGALNEIVKLPTGPASERLENVAAPEALVVAVTVPPRVPFPEAIDAVMTSPGTGATGLFDPSRICTTGWVPKATPLRAVAGGAVVRLSLLGAPAATENGMLIAEMSPGGAVAIRV
jgi:hypothetical protein